MIYKGHELIGHFHCCCRAESGDINEFTIFANVIGCTENTVTLERFQKFGIFFIGEITMSKEDFERYYEDILPDNYEEEMQGIETLLNLVKQHMGAVEEKERTNSDA